jgi:hypothetical protein
MLKHLKEPRHTDEKQTLNKGESRKSHSATRRKQHLQRRTTSEDKEKPVTFNKYEKMQKKKKKLESA